jgi:hypothetical protein
LLRALLCAVGKTDRHSNSLAPGRSETWRAVQSYTARPFNKEERDYMKNITVRLSKKDNYQDTYDLNFDLISSSFLPKWINRFLHAQQRQDPISEPWAFYNLNDLWTEQYTVDFLNQNINTCNDISPGMFTKNITDRHDQDTLNYLHSVFVLHNGPLDTWQANPIFNNERGNELRQCLSHINQTVHRCEGHNGNAKIRVVYFDLPKTECFTEDDYKLFVDSNDFGGMYTLYADVGKNLEGLTTDEDDDHLHDFVPNLHYSVDFQIRFHSNTNSQLVDQYKDFFDANATYFNDNGYHWGDPILTTGSIKLAQLRYDNKQLVLDNLQNYNNIQSVFIY